MCCVPCPRLTGFVIVLIIGAIASDKLFLEHGTTGPGWFIRPFSSGGVN